MGLGKIGKKMGINLYDFYCIFWDMILILVDGGVFNWICLVFLVS